MGWKGVWPATRLQKAGEDFPLQTDHIGYFEVVDSEGEIGEFEARGDKTAEQGEFPLRLGGFPYPRMDGSDGLRVRPMLTQGVHDKKVA
jgi:hypothetical protein